MSYKKTLPKAAQTAIKAAQEIKETGGMSQATADAMAAIANSDCNITDGGEQRVAKCYGPTSWNQLDGFISQMSTAMQNLSNPQGTKYFYKVQLKAYKRASKDAKKVAKAGYRALKTCLRQDPRNVCSRQKSMQMMWAAAPDVMAQVSDIFKNGFDAQTKQKALDKMQKGGIEPENAQFITEWFKNDGAGGATTVQGSGTAKSYGEVKALVPAPPQTTRAPAAQAATQEGILGLSPLQLAVIGGAALLILR